MGLYTYIHIIYNIDIVVSQVIGLPPSHPFCLEIFHPRRRTGRPKAWRAATWTPRTGRSGLWRTRRVACGWSSWTGAGAQTRFNGWEKHGKPWEKHRNPWKKHGKHWKNNGKPWEKHRNPWENHGKPWKNHGKPWEKHRKPWKNNGNPWEKQNPGKSIG